MVRGFFLFISLISIGSLCLSGGANAQTRAEINAKIDALEKQLRAVQRQVFNNESPYFEGSPRDEGAVSTPGRGGGIGSQSSGAVSGSPAPALLADLSLKVDALERQLRSLTGQIEELQYENRRLRDHFERFEKDANLRFRALETGVPAAGEAGLNAQSQPLSADTVADQTDDADNTASTGLVPTPTPEEAEALLEEPAAKPAAAFDETAKAEDLYEQAYSLLRRGQVESAEMAFRHFLGRYRQHPLAGNAQYWLGESYYVRQDYPRAAQAFLTGYQDFSEGAKAADSLLKLGVTLAALGQKDDACAAFDELDDRFPDAEQRITRRLSAERSRLGCR